MSSTLDGITWHAQGEANFYRLMRGNHWVAVVQLNGEMLVWDQEQLLSAMLSSEQPAADPVQEIARQLGIQTFGDGLLAKIRQTIELLQEAADERDQLRAEAERLTTDRNACWEEFKALRRSADAEAAELRAQLAQQQVPGWKLVPFEPTPEMVSAAEEAHMPFGDMDIALRMAILSAPSTPATVQGDATKIDRPLIRNAISLLRLRRPVPPDVERVAADLEAMLDGLPTPAGEPSAAWLEVAAVAAPRPAEVCDVCDGKGYVNVGDGDAQVTCPFCDLTPARQEGGKV